MGLIYQLPSELNPLDDRIATNPSGGISIKSYGLPYLFWGYMAAIDVVIFFMYLAVRSPLDKMIAGDDPINAALATSVYTFLFLSPLVLLGFFFYEKCITKVGTSLIIKHKIFSLPILKLHYTLAASDAFIIEHFLDSPNVAAIEDKKEFKGFQNRGHHLLFCKTKKGKKKFIDRHSQAGELKKIVTLLSRY